MLWGLGSALIEFRWWLLVLGGENRWCGGIVGLGSGGCVASDSTVVR